MKFPYLFSTAAVLLVSCGVSTGDVKSLDSYTRSNGYAAYEYLEIPDSASLADLMVVTRALIDRKAYNGQQEHLYNYYIGQERVRKFAVFHRFKTRGGLDTLVVVHYPMETYPQTNAVGGVGLLFEKDRRLVDGMRSLPDSCMGVWRNWLNPFGFYLIIYEQEGKYYVQEVSPDLGGSRDQAYTETDLWGKLFKVEREAQVTFGTEPRLNTYRYWLNKYNDVYVTDEEAGGGEFMVGVYNYICGCSQEQRWP